MRLEQILFVLLRSQLFGDAVEEQVVAKIDDSTRESLYRLSEAHDLAHIVSVALSQVGKLGKDELSTKFRQKAMIALYRYEQSNHVLQKICKILEEAAIPFVPLKGAVISQAYLQPWMRTSCDIDVLVHEEDLQRAISVLTDTLGYQVKTESSHDVSLFAPKKTHIELHYKLVEDGRANRSAGVLEKVWNMVQTKQGCSYWCEMPDALFYFYHIAHMAKHFENGGCGIRPFLDHRILQGMPDADCEQRDSLLREGDMYQFAQKVNALSNVWFGDREHDSLTKEMEQFIIGGGVYGNVSNKTMIDRQKKGGKWRYLFSKMVLPYNEIKKTYPVLQKHRWLMPFMQVSRWIAILFRGINPHTKMELSLNQTISKDDAKSMERFLKDMGL